MTNCLKMLDGNEPCLNEKQVQCDTKAVLSRY